MVQHKRSYHIDQSVNKTSSKIDSTYPSCPLDAISIIWTFKIPHQFIDKRKKRKPRKELTKGDLNSTARDSGKWLLEMDGHQFVILPTGIDCYGGFCYARCVDCPDIGIQMFWLSSLWADGLMATDVLGFSLKPCLLLSDDPQVRAAARQKTPGEQLAEQGEYLEGGIGVMNTSIIDKANEISDRVRLSDVVESYGVSLSGSGSELKGLCPFHAESTPSFSVNDSKGVYHCFGCGVGGDIVKFVREINGGIGFAEAVHQLSGESNPDGAIAPKRERVKQESPKCNPLPVEARHNSHKKLIKAFGLASWRSHHLIEDRRLTSDEVRWCAEQGFIFDWEPGTAITGVSRQLAGVNPWDGQLVGEVGMAIAAMNPTGQATGYQIKPDNPKKAKYVWASSSWLGNSIHLPNGDTPIFTWKHPEATKIVEVWLCEGALKSLLVALRLWRDGIHHIAVIGTPTSAKYPLETFKQYLAQLNPQIVRLFPDAGVGNNPGVKAGNLQTIAQVSEFGFEIVVGWWGQFEKTPKNDIDDIADWNQIQYLSPDQFKIELGIDEEHTHQPKQCSDKIISKERWDEKFGIPRKFEKFADLLANRVKKFTQKTGFGKPEPESPITLVNPNLSSKNNFLTYVPGELPTVLEWAELGYPDIRVNGDDIEFAGEAIALGYKHILNAKPAGSGKSYTTGQFTLNNLGLTMTVDENGLEIESKKPRIFYLDKNYRNPSTETIEENFIPLPARHAGLSYDYSRKTSLGKPYLIQTPAGKNPDIERSCRDAESFIYSNTKGRPIFGGKNTPLCETCPDYTDGEKVVCPLLVGKQSVLNEDPNISADLKTMPRPRSTDIGIVEEALDSLNPTETVTVSQREILETIGRLATKDEKLLTVIRHILSNILAEIENFNPENKRYGAAHSEVVNSVLFEGIDTSSASIVNPNALLKLQAELAKQKLEDIIWAVYNSDFIKAESAWGNPVWETSFEGGNFNREVNRFIGWKWAAPTLQEFIDECDRVIKSFKVDSLATPEERLNALKNQLLPDWVSPLLKVVCGDRKHSLRLDGRHLTITSPNRRHEQTVKGFQTTFYLDATATTEDLAMAINLKPKDISRELEGLNSELAILLRRRYANAKQLNSFASKFDPETVEQRQKTVNEIEAKIDSLRRTHAQQHILKVVGEEVSYKNLKITVVSGVGKCGHQRFSKGNKGKLNTDSEFALGNRIVNLVKAIAKLNEGKNVALFDHKAFTDNDSKTVNPVYLELEKQGLIHQMAAHFRDSRGINRLTDTEVLIPVGRAIANLGDLASQWQAMTGQIVNPTDLFGEYGAWVKRKVVSEDIQEIARLRANRRPSEQLEAFLIGEYSEADLNAIAHYFTGATIEQVEAYDLCPSSARKGTQTERGIFEAVWNVVQNGVKATTTQVALAVGVSRSRVSHVVNDLLPFGFRQLVKLCEMLYLALNSKTHTFDDLNLTDSELWAAREFLPAVVGDLLNGDTTPEEVAEDAIAIAQHYGSRTFEKILAATPLQTLLKLFGSILPLLPLDDLNAIE